MAAFGDSLTIQILADSSGLQGAISDALRGFEELEVRVQQLAQTSSQLSRIGTALNGMQGPLQSVSRMFAQVKSQADGLSQTTIALNVGPALNALALLSAAITRVQAQLAALSVPMGTPLPVPTLPGRGGGGPIRQFAAGGPVDGPAGIDKVPALLTAGEFVLNRDAVRQLGINFLQQMNQNPTVARTTSPTPEAPPVTPNITTQFGGVTVHVQQPGELSAVLETLMLEEAHLRARRG